MSGGLSGIELENFGLYLLTRYQASESEWVGQKKPLRDFVKEVLGEWIWKNEIEKEKYR